MALRFYKQRYYKKYSDEIWGQVICSKKFSYNKQAILLHYKDIVLRRQLQIKSKFRYFRISFIRRLRQGSFNFRSIRRHIRLLAFHWLRLSYTKSSLILPIGKCSGRRIKLLSKGGAQKSTVIGLPGQVLLSRGKPVKIFKLNSILLKI
jgi:hypothetical protein